MTALSNTDMNRPCWTPRLDRPLRLGVMANPARRPFGTPRTRVAAILLLLAVGCSPYQLAKRTLYGELAEYPRVTEGRLACQQYERWAKAEWQRIVAESGAVYSADYASGFLQGFVDQVFAGGKAQAPPVPPRKYWRMGYRNEQGRQAIQNWYNGFEHGARVAQENGYRERATIPSSLFMSDGTASDGAWQTLPPGSATGLNDPAQADRAVPSEAIGPEIAPPAIPSPAGPTSPDSTPLDSLPETIQPAPQSDLPTPDELFDEASPMLDGLGRTPGSRVPAKLQQSLTAQPLANGSTGSGLSSDAAAMVSPADFHPGEQGSGPTTPSSQSAGRVGVTELPPVADTNRPPAPPWHSSAGNQRAASATVGDVRQISAESPALPSGSADGAFDPFAGTPFESLSDARGASTVPQSSPSATFGSEPTDMGTAASMTTEPVADSSRVGQPVPLTMPLNAPRASTRAVEKAAELKTPSVPSSPPGQLPSPDASEPKPLEAADLPLAPSASYPAPLPSADRNSELGQAAGSPATSPVPAPGLLAPSSLSPDTLPRLDMSSPLQNDPTPLLPAALAAAIQVDAVAEPSADDWNVVEVPSETLSPTGPAADGHETQDSSDGWQAMEPATRTQWKSVP